MNKLPGYDIKTVPVDLSAVFDETNYQPCLTREQAKTMVLANMNIEREYDQLAIEHYMIMRYRDADFFRMGRTDEQIEERFYTLAKLLTWMEIDYAINCRKLYLNHLFQKELAHKVKAGNDPELHKRELMQPELFNL